MNTMQYVNKTKRLYWRRWSLGFTLIEMLVALAVFAILSVLSFQAFNVQTGLYQKLTPKQQRFADLVKAWQLIEVDISQLVARPSRDEFGDQQAALYYLSGQSLRFSTSNWYSAEVKNGSAIQRVEYSYNSADKHLQRTSWDYPDLSTNTPKNSYILLDEVDAFSAEFYDGERWNDFWPQPDAPIESMPKAVSITIEMAGYNTIRRVFHVN